MSTMLDKIIAEVRQLPPDEQRQLQEQLHSIIPSPTEDELEEAFERALINEGIFTDRADLELNRAAALEGLTTDDPNTH